MIESCELVIDQRAEVERGAGSFACATWTVRRTDGSETLGGRQIGVRRTIWQAIAEGAAAIAKAEGQV